MPTITMTSPAQAAYERLNELEGLEAQAVEDEETDVVDAYSKDIVLLNRLLTYIEAIEAQRTELAAALQLSVRYLEHPDVVSMPFALPAATVAERARVAIAKATGAN